MPNLQSFNFLPFMATTPRRNRRTATENTISITVRPLFAEERVITVPENATVEQLLTAGGYSENSEVRVMDGGHSEVLTPESILEDGDVLQIVSDKKITNGY